ncbi:MAG: hypothetical protein JW786_11440 [Desulfobacterales bacterium]|nr:hypothetical protein [Desulfobacterales bacterium]
MWKWIWVIVFLAALVLPTVCPAGYQIKLKADISFITDEYWEEDGKIKFFYSGGTVGLPKEKISTITDSDAPAPKEIIQTDPSTVEIPADSLETEKSTINTIDSNREIPDFQKKEQEVKSAQRRIHNDLITQIEYFNTAKEEKDQAAKDKAWYHLLNLKEEQTQLLQKVQDLYKGTLPEWWNETIQ